MSEHLPTAQATDVELERVHDSNCAPFSSLQQVERFIRAAAILRQRLPAESDHAGTRFTLRDLDASIAEAKRWRANFMLSNRRRRASNFGGVG